jgi:protein-S-isoprenylcysteine O-methyltransferase Ste14
LYFIFVEERSMMQRFGSDYLRYKKHVPRWLPRLRPFRLMNS